VATGGAHGMGLATGATDDDVTAWIGAQAKKRPHVDIVLWNNQKP
jgi:hypothetical protein